MARNLVTARSSEGEGCLNEPMRIFSDFGPNEDIVNDLVGAGEDIANIALNQTIERAGKCVVGILERCDDTKEVIASYLPFLAPYFKCSNHHQKGKVPKGDLDDDQVDAVLKLAKYEQRVYKQANIMLDTQLRLSRTS
eukprot:CAMPEP_0171316226 /NCGR_PEP_ID=MMETSP0816-20121228/71306_1 /TAXON_ID=420281 /ORGANISM="Proboscia inermis, Strain CCAP1064/1" /LENGTH=137 /DNA_ID=CAMNT_0011807951 /DNA_START=138 /DNA_END=548 /DNA_ORIENTATION=-